MQVLNGNCDIGRLNKAIDVLIKSPSFNNYTRLMMSDATVCSLGGVHFLENRKQLHRGIQIIQCEDVPFGEVVVLTQLV